MGRTRPHVGAAAALAPAVAGPQRQPYDRLGRVVALVRLIDAVAWIGPLHVGEAAAQPGHVDPLLRVARRVDVRPAHRGAEGVLAGEAVRAAGGIDPAPGRAPQPRPGVAQVAEAVRHLGATAHQPGALSLAVEPPELELGGVQELPPVAVQVGELELKPGAGSHGYASAASPVDALVGAHERAA